MIDTPRELPHMKDLLPVRVNIYFYCFFISHHLDFLLIMLLNSSLHNFCLLPLTPYIVTSPI